MAVHITSGNYAETYSVTVDPGDTIPDGSVILLWALAADNSPPASTFTWPADFAQLKERLYTDDYERIALAWKRAAGESGTYTIESAGAVGMLAGLAVITGASVAAYPFGTISDTAYLTNNTTIRAAGFTATVRSDLVGFFSGYFNHGGEHADAIAAPAGWTAARWGWVAPSGWSAEEHVEIDYYESVPEGATGDIDATAATATTFKHGFVVEVLAEPLPYEAGDELTDTQLYDLIHRSQPISSTAGAELLDSDDHVVMDLSDYLVGGTVQYRAADAVTRTCQIQLQYALDWAAKPRIRLFQVLSGWVNGTLLSKRIDRGVYIVVAVPRIRPGETPITYEVSGFSKEHLLQSYTARSYQIEPSVGYIGAVTQLLVDAGYTGGKLIAASTEIEALTTPEHMVWLADTDTRWYTLIADVLLKAGMVAIYADEQGRLCSQPNMSLATAPIRWYLDTDDDATNIVRERELTIDEFSGDVNYRVYVNTDWAETAAPTEGDGYYTIDDSGGGTAIPRRYEISAADQATLESLAAQSYSEEKARGNSVRYTTTCWPQLLHLSVVQVHDRELGGTIKGRISEATIPLSITDGSVVLVLDLVP
jgi:hypothetical protein